MSDEEHFRLEELELYALGALPEEEGAAIKAHVASCGECAMRLAQAHGSAALLGFAAKQERPAGTIKAELMARVHASREKEVAYAWPLQKESAEPGQGKPRSETNGKTPWWSWVMVAAAVALALVSLGLSWQNRRLSAELVKEGKAAQALVQDREEIEKLVGVLAAPDTLTVKLVGKGDPASANGVVKYNARMGTMVYSAQLPPAPSGRRYQMWVVPAKGPAVSAGVLGEGGRAWGNLWTAAVPMETAAKSFEVTVEAGGGVSEPTGPKVLVGTN